ncbi:ADP-ribosylglycohydrolase family protein [Pleionea sediminis]|uniref:ADP-ribosylglycohydrolase family protein n=1 Tax=Pleionea sediminis TaxID=2569479 RepID=UPI001186471D|nr:ADP-ribosylglycohydrolase family protein [Pleionea sediminis]
MTEDKFKGALVGLACGDAVGTTVEFSPRGSFKPVTDLTGGGPFHLKPGQWTDDTSMALCLAESLLEKSTFDARDQMARYLNWWQWGYLSSTGVCFDIGNTVRDALNKFQQTGEPYCGSTDPNSAGNGSLMRLAPIVLYSFQTPDKLADLAAKSSRTTHGAAEAIESCQLLAFLIYRALSGLNKSELMKTIDHSFYQPKIKRLVSGDFLNKSYAGLVGSGYCVDSLEAALWCFFETNTYEEAILAAVNLGDDADTTAAITGQIAGAYYGFNQIPKHWVERLYMASDILQISRKLYLKYGK